MQFPAGRAYVRVMVHMDLRTPYEAELPVSELLSQEDGYADGRAFWNRAKPWPLRPRYRG